MPFNCDANEFGSASCVVIDPYSERPRGIPELEVIALGSASMRSCAPRWIHRVSPPAISSATVSSGTGRIPSRSHAERANTPGCHALKHASTRWALRMASTSFSWIESSCAKPWAAAMTDAVVQAMPLVVNTRL